MKKPSCAFLVYKPWRQARRKNDSFDGLSNIGAYMLIDAARKAGLEIGFCSPETASRYDIVLVSFTSNYDVLAYAREVFPRPEFKRRKFKILAGGFGLQNPYPVQDYVDYAWFGRCEQEIGWLLTNWCDVEHPSLMRLPEWRECQINQSPALYAAPFPIGRNFDKGQQSNIYTEKLYGCPNKCFYCNYTWSRQHVKTGTHYNMRNGQAQTLDTFNLEDYDVRCAKLTIGVDGYSQRLRYLHNRRVSNEHIKDMLEHVSHKTEVQGKACIIKLFNITGLETETEEDRLELIEVLRGLRLRKRLMLIIHDTPLHPSPATPIAYAACNLDMDTRRHIGTPVIDTELNNTFYDPYIETSYALLESLCVERAQASSQSVFMDVVFNKRLRSMRSAAKLAALSARHDLTPLIRAYDPDEQLPTWFLRSYTPQDSIRRMRRVMLKKMAQEST